MFAKISWEYFQALDGQMRCRPIFIPAEGFCKFFKIRYKPAPIPPSLAPMEELNFTRVAIK